MIVLIPNIVLWVIAMLVAVSMCAYMLKKRKTIKIYIIFNVNSFVNFDVGCHFEAVLSVSCGATECTYHVGIEYSINRYPNKITTCRNIKINYNK